MEIHVVNGPNLNLLGTREPSIYGSDTLADIEALVRAAAQPHGATIRFDQTNSEGALVDMIQSAAREADGLIINAAAYTHTSIALHDALKAAGCVKIEVHLSNPAAREPFRHHSYISSAVDGTICGLGATGYTLALEAIVSRLAASKNP